jgi:hypothetical protein
MAFKKPIVNKIKADISSVSIYLRSTKKFGKTTLFRDVIMEKYGDPQRGLLVACGNEQGYTMLDNLNVVSIETWEDLVELGNWLITQKGKEHNIEVVAFDTVDELALIADKETIKRSKEETGKNTKSIRGAFGGFGAGADYSANNLIKPYFSTLKKAGFGLWAIAHTNFRQIKEKGGLEEDGYMQLTSNLDKKMESAFGDIFDIVLTGVIDRNLETHKKTVKTPVGTTTKTQNFATDTVRKLYFRGTNLIDAGSRFADGAVPEFIVFDKQNNAKLFIDTIENGIEKSKTDFSPVTEKDIVQHDVVDHIPVEDEEQRVKDDLKAIKAQIISLATELGGTKNATLMATIKSYVPSGNPNGIKDIETAKACLEDVNKLKLN